MGIESRDWYREPPQPRRHGRAWAAVILVFAALAALVASPALSDRLGIRELPFGLDRAPASATPGALRIAPLPGGPALTAMERPLHDVDDPWRAWLASETTCPGGENAKAAGPRQVQTMLCLINYARRREGLAPLTLSVVLSSAARAKARDISRCGRFEHNACGKPADKVARDIGYGGAFGENLYMAEGRLVVPRVALDGWLNSDGHRKNLFHPEWRIVGVALLPGADVERIRDGVIWVNEFGT